jgi:hypothetical protein
MKARRILNAALAFLTIVMAAAAPLATPAAAQTDSAGWHGSYFNNLSLWGTPTWTRADSSINFNWGAGAPDARLPADEFSVRWTRTVTFEAGSYRFNAEADDGIRLYLDGALILDQWRDQPAATYSVERALTAGAHNLRVEYYERAGGAVARVWWERVGGAATILEWRGEYFNNAQLAGAPTLVRNDTAVNFDWAEGSPDPAIPINGFSARWTRALPFAAGRYRFTVAADDGVRLFVDGMLLINQWRDQPVTTYSVDWDMSAGNHTLIMEYYENTGYALARLTWAPVSATPVPPTPAPDALRHWRGEYFANQTLSGPPTYVRTDLGIDFDWDDASPEGGIPRDHFSARWTRTLYFFAGRYRFFGRVDDGVRLTIDGVRVVDAWRDQAGTDYGATRDLTAGNHTIVLEYYENVGKAVITLDWQPVSAGQMADWRGEYFNNANLAGAPLFVRNDAALNFRWGYGSPDSRLPVDNFSARWMRLVSFEGGRYAFTVRSDDGFRLFVDNRIILNEWHDASDSPYTMPINLSAGVHVIMLEYFERTANAQIELSWRGPIQVPGGGNLITCVLPSNSWVKAYQLAGDGNWLDINPRGWGPIAPSGILKIDGLPVDYMRWGAAGNPYKIEVWADGHIIRSTGNTAAGEPEWRLRPDTDNYTPWACPIPWFRLNALNSLTF